ncbi:MAG: hypothetical protein HY203_02870 [Nitrospirae bacterium]|nr:hypothetical protein [Nitrospirota bacterium]
MSKNSYGYRLAIWTILMVSTLVLARVNIRGAIAAETRFIRFQGVIMEHQGTTLVVNERPVFLTRVTKVLSQDKNALREDRLVQGQWVAVEAEQTTIGLQARTIYLLPKRLQGAEESLFTEESE